MTINDLTGYELYSQVYSKFYNAHVDTDFFDRVWKSSWQTILEIGVGQGRLIPFFSSHKISRYVGLDISEDMLAKIPDEYLSNERVQCSCCDFLNYEDSAKFDLIVYSYNTFNYLLTLQEAHQHLAQCIKYLNEGGVIYFDMTFPVCLRNGIGSVSESRSHHEQQEYVVKTQHFYDLKGSHEKRIFQCDIYKNQAKVDTLEWQSHRRYYTIEEMIGLGRTAGLSPIHLEMYLSSDKSFYDGYFLLLKPNPF